MGGRMRGARLGDLAGVSAADHASGAHRTPRRVGAHASAVVPPGASTAHSACPRPPATRCRWGAPSGSPAVKKQRARRNVGRLQPMQWTRCLHVNRQRGSRRAVPLTWPCSDPTGASSLSQLSLERASPASRSSTGAARQLGRALLTLRPTKTPQRLRWWREQPPQVVPRECSMGPPGEERPGRLFEMLDFDATCRSPVGISVGGPGGHGGACRVGAGHRGGAQL